MLRPAIAIAGLLFLFGAVAGGLFWLSSTGPSDPISRAAAPFGYDLVGWEWRHLANRWLYKIGHVFGDGASVEEENDMVRRYFALAADVDSLERDHTAGRLSDEATLDEKRREQQELENKVEDILEGRLTRVLEDEGLTTSLPLFSSVRFVFPPVDFEFDQPPTVLAISPRDEVRLQQSILLRSGLSTEEVSSLEAATSATGVSSLVVDIHAVAFYPSAIPSDTTYEAAVDSMAHEWLHQYFFFHPLGRAYFDSNLTRTLNETAANIGGRELGLLLEERFPLGEPGAPASAPSPSQEPKIDFRKEMHKLRTQVDTLLAYGKVDEAESLMEERREFLAENGYHIRKINQAYFAFNGLYADTPASGSPIGPKMTELRQLSPSVGDFLRAVSGITSEEELDRLLTQSQERVVTPP
ncbi:MAG TPA: hypothetical protein VJ578_03155 [Dehalococcoidia bacterium]|nr:hypothetical protein [Dehalococcoidia bacterium]